MITGIGLVCVYVLEMDEARSFYVDTLGLEEIQNPFVDFDRHTHLPPMAIAKLRPIWSSRSVSASAGRNTR